MGNMAITAPRGKQQVVQACFFFFSIQCAFATSSSLQPPHCHLSRSVFKWLERRRRSGDKIYDCHRGEEKNTSGKMRAATAATAVAATTDDKQIGSDLSTINSLFFFSVRKWPACREGNFSTEILCEQGLNMRQTEGKKKALEEQLL